MSDCGCDNTESVDDKHVTNARHLEVELLYLDLAVCTRCQGTQSIVDSSIEDLKQILSEMGYSIVLTKTHIQSLQSAKDHAFVSSPTVRINNRDILFDTKESLCSSCSDVCGTSVDCRDWTWNGETYDAPPKSMIIHAILNSIYDKNFGQEVDFDNYTLPENIIKYFDALDGKPASYTVDIPTQMA